MPDAIDAAIAAAMNGEQGDGPKIAMTRVNVRLGTSDRHFSIEIPLDMTDEELIAAGGWLLTTLAAALVVERAKSAKPEITVVRSMPQL